MAPPKYFVFFFVVSFLCACHKDKVAVHPSENYQIPCSYFPAHPGTWWVYESKKGKVTFEIDSKAHKVEDLYLPYFKNLDCYIKGCEFYHSAYYGLGQSGYQGAPITREAPESNESQTISTVSFSNLFVNKYIDGATSMHGRREFYSTITSVTNTTGMEFDNVLVMKEFNINDTTHYYLDYFAKGVGLVKRDSIHTIDTNSLFEILTLNQFLIND